MKKVILLSAVLAVTAVAMMTAAGCSKQETEVDEQKETVVETLSEQPDNQETGGAEDKVPDPDAPAAEVVVIYVPSRSDVGLEMKVDDVPEISDEDLSKKLIEYGVLPESAEITEFDPDNHVISYTGVSELTPREAIAVINTFTENFEFADQWELKLDGNTVMKSGYCADYKKIDDSYEGGAEDFDGVSAGGPGVQ